MGSCAASRKIQCYGFCSKFWQRSVYSAQCTIHCATVHSAVKNAAEVEFSFRVGSLDHHKAAAANTVQYQPLSNHLNHSHHPPPLLSRFDLC